VHFAGRRSDVPERLRRAALMLHCRPDEPFGMVLIEAMAAGLPVVAPAAGGPLEIVEDGRTGFLYPAGDAAAAAGHVVRLLRDAELARRMGDAAAQRARTLFSAERQVEQTQRLLAELAA
jgi:glycosyltransferase involved in cell wall biosynthesis